MSSHAEDICERTWHTIAFNRLSKEIRVDIFVNRQCLHIAFHGHGQLQRVGVQLRGDVGHCAVHIPSMLIAPGDEIMPLRRFGKFNAEKGLLEQRRAGRVGIDIAVGIVARIGEFNG